MRRSRSDFPELPPLPSIPLFFKLWFALVATVAVGIIAGTVWVGVQVVQAGPEGVGRTIGAVVHGFNEASH